MLYAFRLLTYAVPASVPNSQQQVGLELTICLMASLHNVIIGKMYMIANDDLETLEENNKGGCIV